MSEEKSIASIRLAIKLNGDYTWIEPKNLYELGEFGEWSLFLHMDKSSEIIFYAGKEEKKYSQMFS
ncbi:MAG: hypothetical protein ACTSRI_03975 [Promethearchaeota archaeon]